MSIYHTTRRDLTLGKGRYLVGILNLTPDSFSDGGDFVDLDTASLHFHSMVKAGAEIIDIGGESTRPGHVPISSTEEIARVIPFIQQVRPHTMQSFPSTHQRPRWPRPRSPLVPI